MNRAGRTLQQSCAGSTLPDILERLLDKGIVIQGDIRVKLLDIELLTIQLKLVICSVDKAREIGLDWWDQCADGRELRALRERLEALEGRSPAVTP